MSSEKRDFVIISTGLQEEQLLSFLFSESREYCDIFTIERVLVDYQKELLDIMSQIPKGPKIILLGSYVEPSTLETIQEDFEVQILSWDVNADTEKYSSVAIIPFDEIPGVKYPSW